MLRSTTPVRIAALMGFAAGGILGRTEMSRMADFGVILGMLVSIRIVTEFFKVDRSPQPG